MTSSAVTVLTNRHTVRSVPTLIGTVSHAEPRSVGSNFCSRSTKNVTWKKALQHISSYCRRLHNSALTGTSIVAVQKATDTHLVQRT